MSAPSQDLINRLQQAAQEGRETITELHQARKDARAAARELQELVATVRGQVIEGFNDLSRQHWEEAMASIELPKLAEGLRATFDRWLDHLDQARKVLDALDARDAGLREAAKEVRQAFEMISARMAEVDLVLLQARALLAKADPS